MARTHIMPWSLGGLLAIVACCSPSGRVAPGPGRITVLPPAGLAHLVAGVLICRGRLPGVWIYCAFSW